MPENNGSIVTFDLSYGFEKWQLFCLAYVFADSTVTREQPVVRATTVFIHYESQLSRVMMIIRKA